MAEPVDPVLRELWSLGGAPGSALRALERPGDTLKDLAPELDEAEQAAEAALAPLLVQPWAAGASAIERALEKQEQVVAAAEAPGVERASLGEWPPPRPRSEPRPARAEARPAQAEARPSRASRFPEPAKAVDAGALERMAALGAGEKTSTPNAAGKDKVEVPERRERRAGPMRAAAGARAALERRAKVAGAGGALHTPVSTKAAGEERTTLLAEAAKARAPEVNTAPGTTSGGKPRAVPAWLERPRAAVDGAQATDGSSTAPASPRRVAPLGAEQALTLPGARTPSRAHVPLSASSALETLARRAEQAGASRALRTPVSTDTAGRERAALLTRAQEPSSAKARRSPFNGPALSQALERAVARASAPVPGREPERARAPVQTAREAAEPRLEGLAGLAARASPARSEPPPAALTAAPLPQPPIPAVLAERMEEAQLARRLQRILRREAEQAGIDLEGLDP